MTHLRQAGSLLFFLALFTLPTTAQLVFENVSQEAGVNEFTYFSRTDHGLGVNWIDFDNDYDADLFLALPGI